MTARRSDPTIRRLVVLGTGDVTTRYLLPALAELYAEADGEVSDSPDELDVVVVSRHETGDDDLRDMVHDALAEASDDARRTVTAMVRHHLADATDADELRPVIEGDDAVAVYLALPPTVFPDAIGALASIGLPEGSRVVFEKPFGMDLDGAVALNEQLRRCLPDDDVFRVDHFLGKQTVQLVTGTRFANRIFEAVWSAEHIERVDIVWDETLALEGRAGFYDQAGALRDMVQNHLMQLFCLVAMEPPTSTDPSAVSDRKVELLGSARPFETDLRRCSTRARYSAGTVEGAHVPAYADSDGVDTERRTETFASVTLAVDTPRWTGVPFTLRSGKALAADRHEIVVTFREATNSALGGLGEPTNATNELRFGVKPDHVAFELLVGEGADELDSRAVDLVETLEESPLGAYSVLLHDVLTGRSNRSVRSDEVEASWRVVQPFLDAFESDEVPLDEYPAGSGGP